METTSLVEEGLNKFDDDDKEANAAKTAEAAPAKAAGTGLKSEVYFNMMNDYLACNQGARILKNIDATFAFEIITIDGAGLAAVFDVDFKNEIGHVKAGKPEKEADATFRMTDDVCE